MFIGFNTGNRHVGALAVGMLALVSMTVFAGPLTAEGMKHGAGGEMVDPSDFNYVVTRGTSESSMPAPQGGNADLDHHGFRFFCVPTHYSYDDPVVYPGIEGAAHLHMFFGNTDVTAYSTSESIINSGRSSCDGGITNRSAYWIPALFNEAGEVVLPTLVNNYYKSWVTDRSKINPIPQGLQILANDDVLGSSGVAVSSVNEEIWSATFRVFPDDGLTVEIRFPDCVAVDANGDPILTSPGGTSHVAYSAGSCPASHPYTIPQLTQNLKWTGVPFDSDWRFASDLMYDAPQGTKIHADYIAGWTEEAAKIMSDCVRDGYRECGPGLQGQWQDQFFSPDGERVYDFFKVADTADPTPDALRNWPAMLMDVAAVGQNAMPAPTTGAPRTEVMIFGNWPDFRSPDGYEQRLLAHKSAFEELRDRLNTDLAPGQPAVQIIPGYEFILQVMRDISSGNAAGINSIDDLFADDLHLSPVGNYGMASLAYAVIQGRNPDDLLAGSRLETQSVSGAQAEYLRAVAWKVAREYVPAGFGLRTPTAPGTPQVFSGNSQTHGWLENLYKPALDPQGNHVAQSILFGSTAWQRWNEPEPIGVQLPETIGDYELVVIGVGPYFSREQDIFDAEASALKQFMDAAQAPAGEPTAHTARSARSGGFLAGETVVTTANLNMRASPGGEVLRVLPSGTVITIPDWSTTYTQDGRDWVGLTVGQETGYVVADYLQHR